MREGPSDHLSFEELACHDETRAPYPDKWRGGRVWSLADAFEDVRLACGGVAIPILSAYRTPEHNRAVGGARRSQHVEGRALDLGVPRGMTRLHFHERILAVALLHRAIRGVGLYPTFIHIDTRPSERLVRWTGARRKADG